MCGIPWSVPKVPKYGLYVKKLANRPKTLISVKTFVVLTVKMIETHSLHSSPLTSLRELTAHNKRQCPPWVRRIERRQRRRDRHCGIQHWRQRRSQRTDFGSGIDKMSQFKLSIEFSMFTTILRHNLTIPLVDENVATDRWGHRIIEISRR